MYEKGEACGGHICHPLKRGNIWRVLSSGEITPFVIKFFASQNTQRAESEPLQTWRVAVRDNGEIHLLAPGEPIPGMGEDDGR